MMRVAMAALLLGGCASVADQAPATIEGVEWRAASIGAAPAVGDPRPHLRLEDGRASGSSGCNRFSGSYALGEGGRIRFGPLASTRMACTDPALNAQESRFLTLLAATSRYQLAGDRLDLIGNDGQRIRFTH